MDKFIDLRQLNNAELFELRKKIVRLKKNGYSGKEIEALTGVRTNRISEIWHRYLEADMEGICPKASGRKVGENTLLSMAHEIEIRRTIIENTPDLLRMPYSLWTRQIVSDFIRRKYNLKLSQRCVTNYLKKWGFVCQKPSAAARQKDAEFISFMDTEYQAIVRRAYTENAGIYWYAEVGVRDNGSLIKSNAPVGDLPPQGAEPKPKRLKMFAAVTPKGTVRFMFFEGNLTQKRFIILLSRLIRYADRKVFFIAENRSACRGNKVDEWVKEHKDRIEIFRSPVAMK